MRPVAKDIENAAIKLLGEIIRLPDKDPLRRVTFREATAESLLPAIRRVGRPRGHWAMKTMENDWKTNELWKQDTIYGWEREIRCRGCGAPANNIPGCSDTYILKSNTHTVVNMKIGSPSKYQSYILCFLLFHHLYRFQRISSMLLICAIIPTWF